MDDYDKSIVALEKKVSEMFGEVDTLNLHLLPLETLEAMKNWYVDYMARLTQQKTETYANFNNAKAALKIAINEKKVHHLKDLTGSDKARIATIYAEKDCEMEILGVAILENEYKEISNKFSSVDMIIRSLMQTISTVKSEAATQQFIKG